jgi:hypothetical protein
MAMTVQEFIERRLPSQLQDAFEEMMGTPTGSRLAQSSAQRRARYILDFTGKLGSSAMSINLLKLVVIGRDALDNVPWLINSLAHEATHIEQKYVSDSFEQEYASFTTAARVMTELGLPDPWGWDAPDLQNLSPQEAARQIMAFYPDHPLYGTDPAIPVYQVRGFRGLIELAKQGWALLKAA